jgi:hypothetical protein
MRVGMRGLIAAEGEDGACKKREAAVICESRDHAPWEVVLRADIDRICLLSGRPFLWTRQKAGRLSG